MVQTRSGRSREPSISEAIIAEVTTSSDEPPMRSREASATSTTTPERDLAAQEAAIRQRIQQLERIEALQAQAKEMTERMGLGPPKGSQRAARRNSESSSSSGGDIRVKNIGTFTTRYTFHKRDDWLADLRRAFEGARKRYRKDYKKILLALDHMDSDCRSRWDRYLDDQPRSQREEYRNSYSTFELWTLSLLRDAYNREPEIYKQLADLRQADT
jgi:hypothetical protein